MKIKITDDELAYLTFLQGGTWYYSSNGLVTIDEIIFNEEKYKMVKESIIKKGYLKQSFSGKKILSEEIKVIVNMYVCSRRMIVFNNIVPKIINEKLLYFFSNNGILKIQENDGNCIVDVINQNILSFEKEKIIEYLKKLTVENQEKSDFYITKKFADKLKNDVIHNNNDKVINILDVEGINSELGKFFIKCLSGVVHNFSYLTIDFEKKVRNFKGGTYVFDSRNSALLRNDYNENAQPVVVVKTIEKNDVEKNFSNLFEFLIKKEVENNE